jgi:hypothetical protein
MTVFLFIDPDEATIMLSAPARSEDGRTRGTLRRFLHPGEDFHGYTYEELLALGPGKHELTFPHPALPKEKTFPGSVNSCPEANR